MEVRLAQAWKLDSAQLRELLGAHRVQLEPAGPGSAQRTVSFEFSQVQTVGDLNAPVSIAENWFDRSGAGANLWMVAVWLGFYGWLLISQQPKGSHGAPPGPTPWRRLDPLLGAFALFTVLSLLPLLDKVVQKWGQHSNTDPNVAGSDLLALTLGSGSIVPVTVSITAAWTWSLLFSRSELKRPARRWVWSLLFSRTEPTRSTRRWAWGTAGITVGLLAALLAVLLVLTANSGWTAPPDDCTLMIPLLGVAGLVLTIVAAALLICSLAGSYSLLGGSAAAATSGLFITLVSVYNWPWTDFCAHVLVVALIATALCALVHRTMAILQTRPVAVRRWLLAGTALLAVATTGPRVFNPLQAIGLTDAWGLPSLFIDPLLVALTVLLVAGIVRQGRNLGFLLSGGLMFVGILLLFRTTTFIGLPVSMLIGGVLLVLVLLRRPIAKRWNIPSDALISDSVRNFVQAVGKRRIQSDYADALRKSITAGTVKQEDLENVTEQILRHHYSMNPVDPSPMSWGGTPGSALRRGAFGAAIATLAGLPFAVEPLAYLLGLADDANGPWILSNSIAAVIGLRFPLYGFAFGFLFPAIRGYRGISKGLLSAAVLAVTECVVILIPFNWSPDLQSILLLRMLQIATVFLALGLAFDIRSLRSAGLSLDRIGDIYNVNKLTVWSSGILVAGAAAFATALLSSAANALLEVITATPQ